SGSRIYILFILPSPHRNRPRSTLRHRPDMKQLIFVVEDEIEACRLARQCLEDAGFAVRTYATADVIREAEQMRPSLMLIAMTMPDGNGLDICRRIRDNHTLAKTPLVFLVPAAAEEQRALTLESGGDDCIAKPFSARELVARVQAVLRRFVPSRVTPIDE